MLESDHQVRAVARLLDGKRRQTTPDLAAFVPKIGASLPRSIASAHGGIPIAGATARAIALAPAST
jgi:hypothetical protein